MNQLRDSHTDRLRQTLDEELGPEVLSALEDPDVVEIFINPLGEFWVSSHSQGLLPRGAVPTSRVAALTATIATYSPRTFTTEAPVLEANLPFLGARYTAVGPPVSPSGVAVAIRKIGRLFDLDSDYLKAGILDAAAAGLLRDILRRQRSMVISGGTGTGKTALLSALLGEVDRTQRVVVLEDTPEVRPPDGLHLLKLRTCFSLDLGALVRTTLRLTPDRLIVGEVRGPEALSLLIAWNTGTRGGLATLHADTATSALTRLELLVQLAGVPQEPARSLIASAVNFIVHLSGRGTSRRLEEILEIQGLDNGAYRTTRLF